MGVYKDMAVRIQECERLCPFCEKGTLLYNGDVYTPRLNCTWCKAEVMVVSLCEEEPIGDIKDGA